MHALDLYKSRTHSEVKLADGKTYKIPNEFTVDEVERVLELQVELQALEKSTAKDATLSEDNPEFKKYLDIVFAQLTILYQHYQPDVTTEYLKKQVTPKEALAALGFFQKYRHIAVREYLAEKDQPEAESKKKLSAKGELREIRRLITFMVVKGFSLHELRRLYIDELHAFYEQLVFVLEKMGEMEKGSYAKIVKRGKGEKVDTVSHLRRQIMAGLAGKRK